MRSATKALRRWAPVPAVLALMGSAMLTTAPAASAAGVDKKTVVPSPTCYFTNPDGTVSIVVRVTSTNPSPVFIDYGGENKIDPGKDDQGQPTTFNSGVTDNAYVATFAADDVKKAKWKLNGGDYDLATTTVCPTTTVTAEGNLLAILAFSGLVTVGGAALMGGRRRRRFGHDAA